MTLITYYVFLCDIQHIRRYIKTKSTKKKKTNTYNKPVITIPVLGREKKIINNAKDGTSVQSDELSQIISK